VAHYCRGVPLHWQPVGPLPAATYWRRRAGVALAVLLVLWIAALPLGGGGDDVLTSGTPTAGPTAAPTAEPSADPTADPTAAPSDAPPAPCPDDALEVTTTTDAESYPVGGTARLEVVVRNTGTVQCSRAVGQGAVELVVTSGDDRIWSSDDCAPGGDEGVVVLDPGATETARASWSTVRSAPECPPDQPQAQAGTYRVGARVGELRAPGAVFTITG
jgi:hypothetical protein